MVNNKEYYYINFFIAEFGVQFGVDFVNFVEFSVDFVDFLLKVFILQSSVNYIFIFIVEFGVDFGVEKSVEFVEFFKKSTLNIGYPMG